MQHSTTLHLSTLLPVENNTKTKAFCGPTAIAAITGNPISVVRDACRMARHGENWPTRCPRAPRITGMTQGQVAAALKTLGVVGGWVAVPGKPTLAGWLDGRTTAEFRSIAIVRVTGHFVAVAGEQFVDTFTKGQVVHVDDAPRRRKRVTHVFIVTGRVPASPVVTKAPAQKAAKRQANRDYANFAKLARSVGATWKKERGDDELVIALPDGRRLFCTHVYSGDWCNAEGHLEDFLATPEPDPDHFEPLDRKGKDWGSLYI